MVELVEQEIPQLEAMGEDRALVRAFRLLAQVHGTAGRYADAAAAVERTIRHATAADDRGDRPPLPRLARDLRPLRCDARGRGHRHLRGGALPGAGRPQGDRTHRTLHRPPRGDAGELRPGAPALSPEPGLARGVRLPPHGRNHVARLVRHRAARRGSWPPPSRSCEQTTGVWRRWASATTSRPRQACSPTSSTGRGATTSRPSSPGSASTSPPPTTSLPSSTGAASQGKLRARQGAFDEAESLLSAATALIETSDQLDLQGNGLLDFAEVRELAGAPPTPRLSAKKPPGSSNARETSSRP